MEASAKPRSSDTHSSSLVQTPARADDKRAGDRTDEDRDDVGLGLARGEGNAGGLWGSEHRLAGGRRLRLRGAAGVAAAAGGVRGPRVGGELRLRGQVAGGALRVKGPRHALALGLALGAALGGRGDRAGGVVAARGAAGVVVLLEAADNE